MTGFWLVSFIVLWVVVVGLALVILAIAREIEQLHARLEAMQRYLAGYPVENRPKEDLVTTSLVSEKA